VILGNKASTTDEEKIYNINSNYYNGALVIKKAKLNHKNWSISF
jgi:hypothetical protein